MSSEQLPSKLFWFVSHHDQNLIIRKVHLIIYSGRRHLSKNEAVGWMRTTSDCEAAASETLIWANSCNKHTLKLYGSISLTLFLSYRVLQASLEKTFFASRHLPEEVLSMKNMAFYINVNTDQRPKIHNSLTETVYRYIQYIKHIWETE